MDGPHPYIWPYHALGPLKRPPRYSWGPKKGHILPKNTFLGPWRSSAAPGGLILAQLQFVGPTGVDSRSPHILTHFDFIGPFVLAARAPKGLFGPDSFTFVAPFWAEFYFCRNIGMWGRKSVLMERPVIP